MPLSSKAALVILFGALNLPEDSLMRKKQLFLTIITSAALLGLAGCEDFVRKSELETNARFWQRKNVTEAAYMEGPKVQQMLHRDIARCVTELRELQRLGLLRTVTPAETMINGQVPDPGSPEGALAQWETPKRDGALRAEFSEYSDFETCMQAKGWERMEHVPYDVALRSREVYSATILREQYRTRTGESASSASSDETQDDDWDHLND